jgi:hypothetical protein
MGDDRRWMYDGWKKNGAHTDEWWEKTDDFIKRAFSLVTTPKIMCPCVKCQNARCAYKVILTNHLIKSGFATDYKTWVFHSEKYTAIAA